MTYKWVKKPRIKTERVGSELMVEVRGRLWVRPHGKEKRQIQWWQAQGEDVQDWPGWRDVVVEALHGEEVSVKNLFAPGHWRGKLGSWPWKLGRGRLGVKKHYKGWGNEWIVKVKIPATEKELEALHEKRRKEKDDRGTKEG